MKQKTSHRKQNQSQVSGAMLVVSHLTELLT